MENREVSEWGETTEGRGERGGRSGVRKNGGEGGIGERREGGEEGSSH